jgi:acetoin utilization deacetylase AcuC-like enzyme
MLRAFYHDIISFPLPNHHRFPSGKYALLRARLADHQIKSRLSLVLADPSTDDQLSLVHTRDYIFRMKTGQMTEREMRRIGFPWSYGLVERSIHSVGSTIASAYAALEDGLAFNLGGGTHHAYPDHGEGFCVFNDAAVAARVLQRSGKVKKIVILDCDVHQGNGSAAIFKDDPSVFTFSIHGEKNFPAHKERSDLDIALADGISDAAYLQLLENGVEESIHRSEYDLGFYLAGADPYIGDRLGRLSITKAGLIERDRIVIQSCLLAGIPLAISMAGGYGVDINDTVDIHLNTIRTALELQSNYI